MHFRAESSPTFLRAQGRAGPGIDVNSDHLLTASQADRRIAGIPGAYLRRNRLIAETEVTLSRAAKFGELASS